MVNNKEKPKCRGLGLAIKILISISGCLPKDLTLKALKMKHKKQACDVQQALIISVSNLLKLIGFIPYDILSDFAAAGTVVYREG